MAGTVLDFVGGNQIQVERFGYQYDLAPVSELCGDLRYPDIAFDRYSLEHRRTVQSMFEQHPRLELPNLGALELAKHIARDSGKVIHSKPRLVDRPLQTNEPEIRSDIRDFIQSHRNGLIVTQSVSELVEKINAIFPAARLIVVSSRKNRLHRIKRELSRDANACVVHAKTTFTFNSDDEIPKVLLSTFSEAVNYQHEQADVVLVLDPLDIGKGENANLLLNQDVRFRLFGVIKPGQKLPVADASLIARVFGFNRLIHLSGNRVRKQAAIEFVNHRQPALHAHHTCPDYLRRAYWQNDRRNRKIVGLANRFLLGNQTSAGIAILVNNIEHAHSLANRLPDWAVFATEEDIRAAANYSNNFRDQLRSRRVDWHRHIVLSSAARRFGGYDANLIIWAGGGPQDEIPESWLAKRDGALASPTIVIDFNDQFHPVAQRNAEKRRQHYAQRDLFAPGADPAVCRIEKFIDACERVPA